MSEKLTNIMGICNRWTQYHKSLRANWKTVTYDEVTDMLVKPIIDIIQSDKKDRNDPTKPDKSLRRVIKERMTKPRGCKESAKNDQ